VEFARGNLRQRVTAPIFHTEREHAVSADTLIPTYESAETTMPEARIYRPTKNAMQSGKANTKRWVLEFEPAAARTVEPLMGWTGSPDTNQQVQLKFDSSDAAVAYAEANGIAHQVIQPQHPKRKIKAYADNFRYDRLE
jgi:hypothetical protein